MGTLGKNERIRFALPIVLLVLVAARVAWAFVVLHLDLGAQKPKTPDYDFSRVTQGQRGTIYSAGGLAYAKTTTVWEYRLDAAAALKDPGNGHKPMDAQRRMRHMRLVAEQLKLPLPKVMDAYANTRNRYQLLAVDGQQEVHDVLASPTNHLKELSIVEKQVRLYPQGRRLSHVLGFVSKDPTNSVGGAGLEQKFERNLKGTPGLIHGEKDAVGREQRGRRNLEIEAVPGCDIHLTIDPNIQVEVERALRAGMASNRAERCWALVLSVKTGAVLAMASLPDYEPANFNNCSPDVKINRAIAEIYEPGSVMKTITACAVLNEGLYRTNSLISTARNDPRYYRLPGDAGHVWEEYMSVGDALVHSSNIVYGKLGSDLGPRRLWEYMTSFGLGRLSGIELPGEEKGLLPNWNSWDKVKVSRAPIGQGVAVTAIQLAAAYAAIGNDGELLRPYLVDRIVQSNGEEIFRHRKEVVGRPISPSVARTVRDMMRGVATKSGTARRAAVPGYTVAGKTGTAQMKEGRGYSTTAYNASFIGIVPATRPEVVILVTFQKPLFCRSRSTSEACRVPIFNHQGGVCAAPVFREIAKVVLRYLEVEPDNPEEIPDDEEEMR